MCMGTIEMIASLKEGQIVRLVSDHVRISVIRKGSGFFYKDHPKCEPEKNHLVLNVGTMEARWELEEQAEPIFVDTASAMKALLHGVELKANLNDKSVPITVWTRLSDLLELSSDLRVQDLLTNVKWQILAEE